MSETYDLVIPVPLHPTRLRERGYNQCDLLAKGVAQAIGGRRNKRLLRRTRFDGPQAELNADQRSEIQGAFAARPCEGARILIVDDVTTTGHTLEACRLALIEAGASVVHGFALAFTEPSGALDALGPS
ncbi:MAG: putative amidophosphoribosyltransferase [Bradymonadia bacterium]|jgi:predicted amidophosphoribosyltransferase